MPTGKKKTVKETLPQGEESRFDAEKANAGVCYKLDEIENRLLKLETDSLKKAISEIPVQTPTPIPSSAPVPSDYVDLVTTILNSKFSIKIEYFTDRPQFMLTIVVPDEYATQKPDLRSKVLNMSDGINGVREWINLVYSNFNPEIKAQIKSSI